MKIFELIYVTLAAWGKQLWHLPQTLSGMGEQRRQRVLFNEHEAERLDRIRNPSKYLGK